MRNLSVFYLLLLLLIMTGKYALSNLDLPGPFSHHMLWHIMLMNVIAPLCCAVDYFGLRSSIMKYSRKPVWLPIIALAQLVLLLAWHTPPAMLWVLQSATASLLMQASLFAIALLFWYQVFAQIDHGLWRALIALLVTGKVYCLLAALLVFAPRSLYSAFSQSATAIALNDQQFAGVLMVVACPLSYVLAATILAARWLRILDQKNSIQVVRSL